MCVTFDDGYRDNLLEAAPVLAELDIPATIFVPSRIIDGDASFHWYEDPPPALSWNDVGELLGGGLVDVQSHTLTHPLLPQVDAERSYEEIAGSRAQSRHMSRTRSRASATRPASTALARSSSCAARATRRR